MEIVNSPKAPAAVGPYSHSVKCGGFLFCSGQLGIDPAVGKIVEGGVEAEIVQVFKNIEAVLAASSLTFANVVKTTIFLKDMASFAVVNKCYAETFGDHKPARSTVEVAKLPLGGLVEIECIASLPS